MIACGSGASPVKHPCGTRMGSLRPPCDRNTGCDAPRRCDLGPHGRSRALEHARARRRGRAASPSRTRDRGRGRHRIGGRSGHGQLRTTSLLSRLRLTALLVLGDAQYENGLYSEYRSVLPPHVGAVPPQDVSRARQPRLPVGRRTRLLQLLRPPGARRPRGLLQLRSRTVAPDRAELRGGRCSVARPARVAAARPAAQSRPLRAGVLAPSALLERREPRVGPRDGCLLGGATAGRRRRRPERPRAQLRAVQEDAPRGRRVAQRHAGVRRGDRRQGRQLSVPQPSPAHQPGAAAGTRHPEDAAPAGDYSWRFVRPGGRVLDRGSTACHP